MRYIALLRGINVGGRNLLKMADVRSCLETKQFECVSSYIQSGNILFESDVADVEALTASVETALSAAFSYEIPVFLRSQQQLKRIIGSAPREWTRRNALRCNVAFLRKPLTAKRAVAAMDPKPGVDVVHTGDGVVYMSTLLKRLQQSGFRKIVAKDIYRDITVRNYSTCQKILALMETKRA